MKRVPLGELCDVAMGQAPSGESYNTSGEGTPLLAGAGDFGVDFPKPQKFTTAPWKMAREGDIILCIRATIGDLNWADQPYCLGRGVFGLRPKNGKLEKRYLWYWISVNKDEFAARGKGSTFKQVSRADIEEFEIPVPNSVGEQRWIVTILDKADAIRRKHQQALALADDFLHSTFLHLFGDPVRNPKNYLTKPLGSIADLINGDRSDNYPNQDDITKTGILFLGTPNLRNGGLSLSEKRFITEEKFTCLGRGKLKRHDLIITLRGTLGLCAEFDCEYETGFINAQMMIIRSKNVKPRFLLSLINQTSFQNVLKKLGSGTAVPQLTAGQLSALAIMLPSIQEQQRFLEIIDSANTAISRYGQELRDAECLFASLSQRAFRGELQCVTADDR